MVGPPINEESTFSGTKLSAPYPTLPSVPRSTQATLTDFNAGKNIKNGDFIIEGSITVNESKKEITLVLFKGCKDAPAPCPKIAFKNEVIKIGNLKERTKNNCGIYSYTAKKHEAIYGGLIKTESLTVYDYSSNTCGYRPLHMTSVYYITSVSNAAAHDNNDKLVSVFHGERMHTVQPMH